MDLPDDDPGLITRMLSFMYTGDYCTQSITCLPSGAKLQQFSNVVDRFSCARKRLEDRAILHCLMFALADKYGIRSLRKESFSRFVSAWFEDDEDLGSQYRNGPIHEGTDGDSQQINDKSLVAVNASCRIVRAVYEQTQPQSRELRRFVVGCTRADVDRWRISRHKCFRDLICLLPEFARDLALATLTTNEASCVKCEEKQLDVLDYCACGNYGACDKEICKQKWVDESVCENCYAVGVMEYPKVD